MKWLYLLAVLAVAGCGKDKFESKPELRITKVEPDVVPQQGVLTVTFDFKDKEGDISDTLFYSLQRLNRRRPVTRPTVRLLVPKFPARSSGELSVDFTYAEQLTVGLSPIAVQGSNPPFERDTLRIAFMLQDKAGNRSDTAVLQRVVVIR